MGDAASEVRGEWLYETARQSQEILCEARANGQVAADIAGALAGLPAPATPIERLVRQGLVFEVLLGCVAEGVGSRDERTLHVVRHLLESRARPSPLWESLATRAAAMIYRRSTDPIDVAHIARTVGCDQTRLRRSFRDRFGISMREFHTRCRIADAISMFATGEKKTAAVARSVGYRSQKNFYRALRDVTGKRPKELKSIPMPSLRRMARDILPGLGAAVSTSGQRRD